ncbi:hypothetical protein PF005_g27909 [Phytophthora fragariae]|uniref:Uncharacterized protein n=2 Tax=Phytophthora TaxID=4783 RepID=A0A6A3R642_9STRA|nr:hypothetical protein PF003_g24668 [Phytophthora fragariae]KAE9020574.1 hypothetical protein PR002_g12495 [Phytophthora rubi]KAE8923184.1 hypothetical protein PF009_g26561 [Phytophthora fragariae]KAE8974975.1 hypothetical protein PF011_g24654 [Phytophthora fragariae]KAE9034176.1 hypothetical protein PR001_g9848 [Phytophthora rubi]
MGLMSTAPLAMLPLTFQDCAQDCPQRCRPFMPPLSLCASTGSQPKGVAFCN